MSRNQHFILKQQVSIYWLYYQSIVIIIFIILYYSWVFTALIVFHRRDLLHFRLAKLVCDLTELLDEQVETNCAFGVIIVNISGTVCSCGGQYSLCPQTGNAREQNIACSTLWQWAVSAVPLESQRRRSGLHAFRRSAGVRRPLQGAVDISNLERNTTLGLVWRAQRSPSVNWFEPAMTFRKSFCCCSTSLS